MMEGPKPAPDVEKTIRRRLLFSAWRRRLYWVLAVVIAAALVGGILALQALRRRAVMRALFNPVRIEMEHGPFGGPPNQKVVVTHPSEIQSLTNAIRLEPKKPCECLHVDAAYFIRNGERVWVSLCDHCFDISVGTGKEMRFIGHYKMPPDFYREFLTHFNAPPAAGAAKVAQGAN